KEFDARLRALAGLDQTLPPAQQILSTDAVYKVIDDLKNKEFFLEDWGAAAVVTPPMSQGTPKYDGIGVCPAVKHNPPCDPSRMNFNQCRPLDSMNDMKSWALQRNAALRRQIPQ